MFEGEVGGGACWLCGASGQRALMGSMSFGSA